MIEDKEEDVQVIAQHLSTSPRHLVLWDAQLYGVAHEIRPVNAATGCLSPQRIAPVEHPGLTVTVIGGEGALVMVYQNGPWFTSSSLIRAASTCLISYSTKWAFID